MSSCYQRVLQQTGVLYQQGFYLALVTQSSPCLSVLLTILNNFKPVGYISVAAGAMIIDDYC